jgi:hypothetical protein
MAVRGLKSMLRALSSTAHLEILPVALVPQDVAERVVCDDGDQVLLEVVS